MSHGPNRTALHAHGKGDDWSGEGFNELLRIYRCSLAPVILPVDTMTAFMGVPLFLYLF